MKSFDKFKSNYEMNKSRFTLIQLLNELSTYQSMKKDSKGKTSETNVTEPSSSGFKKRKRSIRKAKAKPKQKHMQKKKQSTKTDKSKGKCFHCDKVGHWKKNYPKYLEEFVAKKKVKVD
ncbi:hypothetical protein ACOSQ4_032455 [Xanthoceras sorbifolium]